MPAAYQGWDRPLSRYLAMQGWAASWGRTCACTWIASLSPSPFLMRHGRGQDYETERAREGLRSFGRYASR